MEQIQFDPFQFANKYAKPVHAERGGDREWSSTGIDFSDYARSMSTTTHKPSGERRLPTPEWALNDDHLRSVLVRYMEQRALVAPAENLPPLERLERARKALLAQIPATDKKATALCVRYVKYKKFVARLKRPTPEQRQKLRKYEQQIENIDTCLRMRDCAGIVLRAVYLYYRLCWDSVAVGAALRLKPPHVRQILWRLNQVANGNGAKCFAARSGARRTFDHDIAYALRAIGHTYREIANALGAHYEAVRPAVMNLEKLRKEAIENEQRNDSTALQKA